MLPAFALPLFFDAAAAFRRFGAMPLRAFDCPPADIAAACYDDYDYAPLRLYYAAMILLRFRHFDIATLY